MLAPCNSSGTKATKGTRVQGEKEPHKHVAPHELSSQFLLRVWPEDRAAALVSVDQQEVLRQVLARIC